MFPFWCCCDCSPFKFYGLCVSDPYNVSLGSLIRIEEFSYYSSLDDMLRLSDWYYADWAVVQSIDLTKYDFSAVNDLSSPFMYGLTRRVYANGIREFKYYFKKVYCG
ncbi:hypothetical protein Sulku_1339 [Sulfuricurvum kujiense DSM 16994]|uniref:Uncharacterized protein n=1 Tax=Sulfuricurvum kujiense (strain ATCC BAA-921 / DSM 16994 / JCM 11577 / YK-1) TaxID=709032 RepID=E4TY82_SULKY|nr:hypothetical protein Sulku_1339 [Sulfuricurvum kujiense DSM 16994]